MKRKNFTALCLFLIYAAGCAERVRKASPKLLMQGLGEVLNDTKSKAFVKNRLIEETASALEVFSAFPLIAKQY